MEEKRKTQTSVLFFTIAVIFAVVVVLLITGKIGGEDKIASLTNKNNKIKTLNETVIDNEDYIKNTMEDIVNKKDSLDVLKEESFKSREFIDSLDLELHLPSFLVDIGLKAKELDLDLIIHYNEKKVLSKQNNDIDNTIEELDEDDKNKNKEDKTDDEEIEDSKEVEELDEEPVIEEPDNEDISENTDNNVPANPNQLNYYYNGDLTTIDQISIPLEIEGRYNDVRSFLYYIDNLDVIDSRNIKLTSDGELVKGDIMLHIFYKGVRD